MLWCGAGNPGFLPYAIGKFRGEEGEIYEISKIEELSLDKLTALMEELCELNVLRKTSDQKYLFNQYRFHQMMGSHKEVDDKLMKYMEESNG